MGLMNASCSFTRFRLVDEVPHNFWPQLPQRLKHFAFQDIDDSAEERSFGWTCFDDMLDTQWDTAPPDKGAYIVFSLRMDTRRVPAGVIKKHLAIALRTEKEKMAEQGKKFVSRERKKELKEQVFLRLRSRFLPVPAEFNVLWEAGTGNIWFTSTQEKMLQLFMAYFTQSFNLHIEQMTPYALAASMLDERELIFINNIESTQFSVNEPNTPTIGSPDVILGQEFLTWLWFKSDTDPDFFTDIKGIPFDVSMEQHIVVQGGGGDSLETASVSGTLSSLREARFGLTTGKKVTRALLRFEQDDLTWQVGIKAEDFSCNSLRTPKIEKFMDDDDPDALFLEKVYLIERCLKLLDNIFVRFLTLRISNTWKEETHEILEWL